MAELTCPSCGARMQSKPSADVTIEECPSCGGIFLNKSELNALVTGMAGNIECLSVDEDLHTDKFPLRNCPKCPDQPMRKVNLLHLSDLVFDYCPACDGFYLDKGEIEEINRELRSMAPNQEAEEYREMHGRHLVRIDQSDDVMQADYLGITQMVQSRTIRVTVYFADEMPSGFHVARESWARHLVKVLGLHLGEDVETGDRHFDAAFRVHCEKASAAMRHLDAPAREKIMAFVDADRKICDGDGSLQITSSAVVYVETPCSPRAAEDLVDKAMPIVEQLVAIADAVEAGE